MTTSLAPAPAAESGHTTEEDEDGTVPVAESAPALPLPASQPSNQGEARPRRLHDKSPLVEPVLGALPAHARRLSAAFSAASEGTTVLPENASNRKSPLSAHAGGMLTAPHARVASVPSGTVSATALEAVRLEAAPACAGDLVPDPLRPAFPLGTYVQVKHTSQSLTASSTTRPTQGVICFQRSRPGAWSPEILVYVDAGSTTFSGLPLAPPSANGWSSRSVTKSLKDFVAITPRVRQCLHRAVDRNPWGQVSEPSTALLRGLVRNDVAVWVVNLTAAASADLLDCKDTVECDSDCRWIPSTTALAVDRQGGLRLAQVAAALQIPARVPRPPARRRPRASRQHRSGRFCYDQAMKLPCNDRSAYNTVMRVYSLRHAPTKESTTPWTPPQYPPYAPPVLLPGSASPRRHGEHSRRFPSMRLGNCLQSSESGL